MSTPAAVHQHHPQQYYSPNPSNGQSSPTTEGSIPRSQSTRTPTHSRQTSINRTPSSAYHRGDPPPASRRESDYISRGESSGRRPDHSRQPSNMTSSVTNGGSSSSAPVDESGRAAAPAKQRKTTIQGISGTWILGKTIGAGSMGKVKIARKVDSAEQCAVKIVPRASTDRDPNGRASRDESKEIRTAREAAIVTLLDHPYICGMRDVVRTNNHWYMLFEYVNGGQMLDYIISHGRLKEKQARKFGRQIASALDYCHRNSIVHRDLKIENILISKTGDIKIIDFGLSNLFSPRSMLNTFCGSLYFAAPELLQARPYTGPEVDLWSFGIVLYVLVCGKVPFDDQSMPALHAKIKRGAVDYPAWLSADCKSLLSRLLVTDPKNRATLSEIMSHPWIVKGSDGSPKNYLPQRDPITLPLDSNVITAMTGFEFGSPENITYQLTRIIESEDYQAAARAAMREASMMMSNAEKKKPFQFDFYKRRSSTSSNITLANASSELLSHPYADSLNAYHPLLSIYYLVREKQDRDKKLEITTAEASTAHAISGEASTRQETSEKALQVPVIPVPEIAHTSESSYEVKGETTAPGGRTRPRARTHGDEEIAASVQKLNLAQNSTVTPPQGVSLPDNVKKESTAAGLLRRLSTRKYSSRGESKHSQTPSVNLQPPGGETPNTSSTSNTVPVPRSSLNVPRNRNSQRMSSYEPTENNQQYLTPPATESTNKSPSSSPSRRSSKIGRSTSVSEVDRRKRHSRVPDEVASDAEVRIKEPTTPSKQNTAAAIASRAKSLGHARRESYSIRRSKKEEQPTVQPPGDVPEENDNDPALSQGSGEVVVGTPSIDYIKPVFLKGLLSVSTTTSKSPIEIRADVMRVLSQLGVNYKEIRGGFACTHKPSIDLKTVVDNAPQSPEMTTTQSNPPGHRRKISFGGDRSATAAANASPMKSPIKRNPSSTDDRSAESMSGSSTQIQSELGGSMVLQFEIYIVKVPLMNLYGIQQKKMSGNTWSYKNMITKIISELRL